jgi:hypothetical protein
MATNRELLKEAIADAKSIKEMAIANAKTALEETITPRLKEMLSAKIQEIDEEDSKSMEEMKYEEDDTDKKMEEGMYEEDDTTVDEAGFEPMTATSDDQGFDSLKGNIPEGDDLDELELEELLAELEKEDKEEKVEETLNEAEDDEKDDDKKDDDSESEEKEGEPLDLEDMTDEDLKKMIEDVIADMVASGELEGGDVEDEEKDEEVEMSDEMSDEMDEEEVDLAELLREIEEEVEQEISERKKYGGNKGDIPASKRGDKKDTAEEEGVEDYKKKLKEAKLKIESLENELKGKDFQLNEAVKETNVTNLLNAKLLYTNKIFKSKNLNESQKIKILESFDKANTAKEAKLVYETLSESLKVKKNTIKENLGRASKATTIPKTKKPIVESNEVFARMQKLAGIIK